MGSPEKPINVHQTATRNEGVVLPRRRFKGKLMAAFVAITLAGGAGVLYKTNENVQEAVNNTISGLGEGGLTSTPDIIKPINFVEVPPRGPVVDLAQEQDLKILLGNIEKHTEFPGSVDNFNTGLKYTLQERPDTQTEIQVMGPNGQESRMVPVRHYPGTRLDAYVLRKEINPDDSLMLAIWVPGKSELLPDDIDKSLTSIEVAENSEDNEGVIRDVIVWIHIKDYSGYSSPFFFRASWGTDFSGRNITNHMYTNQPEEIYSYIKVGDPLQINADNSVSDKTHQQLIENYQKRQGNMSYEEALQEYPAQVNSNGDAIRRMLEDARSETVTLRQQLEEKRYVLKPWKFTFLPRRP